MTDPWAELEAGNRRLHASLDAISRQLRGMTIGVGVVGVVGVVIMLKLAWTALATSS